MRRSSKWICMFLAVWGAIYGTLSAQSAPTTAEDLIRQVLAALAAKDQALLEKLAITPEEYKKYVWPEVAAMSSGTNAEKSWGIYQKTSAVGITANLSEFGGRKLELVRVSFDAPIRQTKAYRLHSAPIVVVKDEAGQEKTIRLAGSVLEHDGRFRIGNYFARPATAAK